VDSAKRDLTAVVEWGRQKMQEGAYDEAAKLFSKSLEMKPGFMQALVSRGFCYLTLGDEERAQLDFVAVINKDAGFNRNIYVLMALCCKRSGDYHTAIRYLNRCIGHFPSFKPALMARGELCLKVRDFERSRTDFKQVLQDEPMHLVARRGFADSFRGMGNFREAERQYGRAINDTSQALEHHRARQESIQQRDISEADHGDIVDDDLTPYQEEGISDYDDRQSDEKQRPSASSPDEDSGRPEELLAEPDQLRAFLTELLVRRAMLLRLMNKLESAGSDLLEVLELEPQDGLALFWYGKVLIEQQRHQEAFPFLQASIQHHETTAMAAHALMGALLMIQPDPDFEAAQRHLKEATRLSPASQSMRVTLWICSAAVLLNSNPRDASGALELLDRALAALEASPDAPRPEGEALACIGGGGGRPSGSRSARGPASGHMAGSGGAAAALLSARSRSAEEARWSATRSLVKHQQDLAQGDDLEQALLCSTFLQLVAREPQQRAAHVPSMLFQLRVTALCDLCRWEEAVADCRRALILEPGDEPTQYTMHVAVGIIRSQASKFEAAVGCFTKAIRLQPVSTEARLHRAIVLACAARAHGVGASSHDTARVAQLLTMQCRTWRRWISRP
jgi:tetratricopeptide (TPR) repeat protein